MQLPRGYGAAVTNVQLRDVCGVRSGDKGDLSDLTLFMDDRAAYDAVCEAVTVDMVATHLQAFVDQEAGEARIDRYEVPNLLALKFVLHGALGGGGPRSLRSDNLGKTLGGALLRMRVDLPDEVIENAPRRGRRAPIDRTPIS